MGASAVRAGDIVAGKFQIERVLGEGGMGYVVAARHLQLGQTVALKFMREEVITSEYKSRFLREARNTVRLKSKHVSRVLDVGTLDGGSPYMVMEYLEGTDLSAMLHKRGAIPIPEACDYVIQACEAIAEAHGHNIVHRDLKPANLFLTRGHGGEPVVKVLDFGVSKVLDLGVDDETVPGGRGGYHDKDSVVTKATDLLGSPSYMAPEQVISARDADARSDVWSLGVILFRLISGRAPFVGASLGDLIQNIIKGPLPNLRENRPDIPEGLEQVVMRCLARERERRPDAVELARLLAPYAGPNATPSMERIAILGPALVRQSVPPPQPSVPPQQPSGPSLAPQQPSGPSLAPSGPSLAPGSQSRAHVATVSNRGPGPTRDTSSLWLWGVAVILMIASGIMGVFIYRRSPPQQPQPSSAAPSATVATTPVSAEPPAPTPPPPAPTPPPPATTESVPSPPVTKPTTAPTVRPHPTAHPKPRPTPTKGGIPSSRFE